MGRPRSSPTKILYTLAAGTSSAINSGNSVAMARCPPSSTSSSASSRRCKGGTAGRGPEPRDRQLAFGGFQHGLVQGLGLLAIRCGKLRPRPYGRQAELARADVDQALIRQPHHRRLGRPAGAAAEVGLFIGAELDHERRVRRPAEQAPQAAGEREREQIGQRKEEQKVGPPQLERIEPTRGQRREQQRHG
jgi:hypothetical protein